MSKGPVYDELQSLIIRGRLAPGVRIVENEIADRLRVSRTPAREAIRRLYQEGFLIATPTTRRTELVVAPLTRDDMMDLYRVMAALEGSAARDAVTLGKRKRYKLGAELKAIEMTFERSARATKTDYDRVFELHNAFHECLVAACAPPRHRAIIDAVRPQVDRYEWVYAPLVGPDFSDTFDEHSAIIRAVRDGTAAAVERAVAANWSAGASRLARVIGSAGSRGDWQHAES